MLINAKNMQFDTTEIRTQLAESLAHDICSSDKVTVDKLENYRALSHVFMALGIVTTNSGMHCLVYAEANTLLDYSLIYNMRVGKVWLNQLLDYTIGSGIFSGEDEYTSKLFGQSIFESETETLKRIVRKVNQIEKMLNIKLNDEDEAEQIRFNLILDTPSGIEELYKEDPRIIKRLDSCLDAIYNMLVNYNMILGSVFTSDIVSRNVSALNIIKLVKKGTDTPVNFYTGECLGVVLEALTINKKGHTMESPLSIHKKLISIGRYPGFETIIEQRPKKVATQSKYVSEMFGVGKHEMTDSFTTSEYIVYHDGAESEIDSATGMYLLCQSSNLGLDRAKMMKARVERDKAMASGKLDTIAIEDDSPIVDSELFKIRSMQENQFIRLFIPKNVDLSNSFKAKYV